MGANQYVVLGFTGTRTGMSAAQKRTFAALVRELQPGTFRHGACVGADEDAAAIVRAECPLCRILAYPGVSARGGDNNEHRSVKAIALSREVMPEETHFARNRRIVLGADLLVATPWQSEEPTASQGGTWYTIAFARRQKCKVRIIWPDGSEQ